MPRGFRRKAGDVGESRAKDAPICEATLLELDNDELRAEMLGVSGVQHSVYLLKQRTSAHVELKH